MTILRFDHALTPDGWERDVAVTVSLEGVINAVEPNSAFGERVRGFAIPGLANLHSHAFQRAMAGLTEHAGAGDDSFWSWRELMYRFLGRISPEDAEMIAAHAFAQMLEGGFTTVGEFHYLHHAPDGQPYANLGEMAERHVAAASETGIGMTLLPVFYAQGNFGAAPPNPGQRRFLNKLDGFGRLFEESRKAIARLPAGRIGVAPHSLRAVSLPDLQALMEGHPSGPVHIHVSEQVKELEDCRTVHGTTPIALLADHVSLDARWCLVHATHASEEEQALMLQANLVAGLCPLTEANLGDGIFATRAHLAAGGRLGVGTDSNIQIDAASELRQLEYAQRLLWRGRNVLAPRYASTGRALFDRALAGGAQALDLPSAGLFPGAQADIVVLDAEHTDLIGREGDRAIDSWVFVAGKSAIRDVYAGGKQVVVDGRHVAQGRISERYRSCLKRLLA
ncbi:SsnA Cytosine deaminase and related metal-dependent hydrolases [Rhabdaerophilaceae bacterium]